LEAIEPAVRQDHVDTSLDAVIGAAVAEGLDAADRLALVVDAVLDRCLDAASDASSDHGDRPGRDVIAAHEAMLTEKKVEAERRFARQRTRLETFNLVLFGRTGVGKSCLIEALSSGDGEAISRGESDWTTDVREVRWRSSRLVDTPGIGGWGRTRSRAELEARAEAAVEDADVVVLCFDTQSQQDGEFSKVAAWVSRYGKPVIAVLNCRNPRWRHPLKATSPEQRRTSSQSVMEHAGHIRDELASIKLPGVPVVAVHSQRAAFARTRDPYSGPFADSRRKQRAEYGPERMLEWSNLPALEALLTEALAGHAERLRLGMLREQARGLLVDVYEALCTDHDESVVLAETLERGVADVLDLVGRPAGGDLAEDIIQLEEFRGGFGVASDGELLRHARYRLAAGLHSAKSDALRRAERLVEKAFEERANLASDEFDRKVLAPARTEAETAARTVAAELQRYLSQRLALVADDLRADLTAAVTTVEEAKARTGRITRALGVTLESASGVLSIASSTAVLFAAANVWNPAGWVIGAVWVGSLVATFAGNKLRKKAASDKLTALSQARSNGRRAVTDTFDHLEHVISEDLNRILSEAAHEQLAADVAQATALRRLSQAANVSARVLRKAISDLPVVADTSRLLLEVSTDLQRRCHPGEPNAGRLLWLGEDWCSEPGGLTDSEAMLPTAVDHDPVPSGLLLARVRSVTDGAGLVPVAGASAAWVSATCYELGDDEEALSLLTPLWEAAADAPPRIVLAGDYSTGKSSFIKRLLVDSGLSVPEELEVAAQPKTASAEVFRWGEWELVDTPGFQSTHAGHAQVAKDAVVGASLLIVLFNPNLLVGATSDLVAVLLGDGPAGRAGKMSHTLFVINRSDELGIDPREDPAGFQNLCRRKELELAQALGALLGETRGRHGQVGVEQILCVASDPYGLAGDRSDVSRAHYDQHRDWDGMDPLGRVLIDASVTLGRSGVGTRILEGSAATLGELVAVRRERLAGLEAAIAQRQRLLLDLDACLGAGQAVQAAARERLVNGFVGFVAQLLDDVAFATDNADKHARVTRLKEWDSDPELQQFYEEWTARFAREQQEWQDATTGRIEARLTSAAFAAAFPDGGETLDVEHLEPEDPPIVWSAATDGAKGLAKYAAKVPKETVIKAAHRLGHKFKPWGATKLTVKINKAGGVLGIAAGAVELHGVWRSVQKEGEDEQIAHERRGTCLQQVRGVAAGFFDGTEPDAPGVVMRESLHHVQRARDDEASELGRTQHEAKVLTQQIRLCEQRMRDALEHLEAPEHDG
jgi:predicted GTPase